MVAEPARNHPTNRFLRSPQRGPSCIGFLLADLSFTPLYVNAAAIDILADPQGSPANDNGAFIQKRIRSILQAERFTTGLPATGFRSGGHRYACRPFLVEAQEHGERPPMVAVLIEHSPRDPVDASELSKRFQLSPRECETVQYLIRGLTTKEIAQRMGVSPNTIKQFIRLIMTKMAVTTRSGIIGRLMFAASFDR
jgi:DNA-binding CsgD family transcriptional regulator